MSKRLALATLALAMGLALASGGGVQAQLWPFGDKPKEAQRPVPQPPAQQAQVKREKAPVPAVAATPARPVKSSVEERRKIAINSNTVGLAAGRIEGAPLQFAGELARVLDDGDNLRVLPIVTRGIFDNVFDLLYLKGVDAAIVYGDVLEHFKKTPEISGISKRIHYIASLFPSELHIFVRPEINSLQDLVGKKVNFNTPGTAAAYSGPIIFDRLGIKVQATFDAHSAAMQEMRKGETYAATVWVSSKPLQPFLKGNWPPGFKFLSVPYTDALEYYLPAELEHEDYPSLIAQGQKVSTIAVPAVLAVYDWPEDTDRYRRMVKFVDYLFDRLPTLQKEAGFHKSWKDVNLGASVPGWTRFKPLGDRLRRAEGVKPNGATAVAAPVTSAQSPSASKSAPAPASATEAARLKATLAAPGNPAEQERLFREFLEWRKRQGQ